MTEELRSAWLPDRTAREGARRSTGGLKDQNSPSLPEEPLRPNRLSWGRGGGAGRGGALPQRFMKDFPFFFFFFFLLSVIAKVSRTRES